MLVEMLDCMEPGVVSFVGGGGKTSAIRRLALDLNKMGRQVVVTTTTRLAAAEGLYYKDKLFTTRQAENEEGPKNELPSSDLLLVGSVLEKDKLLGISPEEVDKLYSLAPMRYFLIEADGSAKKPFKAPGIHEPVIPSSSKLVVVLVGARAIGLPLLPDYLHRPECISQLTGLSLGDTLTVEAAAKVILHQKGYRKNIPPEARFVVIVNLVQPDNEENARQLAWHLREAGVERVLLTNVLEELPVKEVIL